MTDERKAELFDSVIEWVATHCFGLDPYVRALKEIGFTAEEMAEELGENHGECDGVICTMLEEHYPEADLRVCPECLGYFNREDMLFTHDCHGIPFRLVCPECYEELMEKGYDGEYYTEADEQIEDDY